MKRLMRLLALLLCITLPIGDAIGIGRHRSGTPPDPTAIFGTDLVAWYDVTDAATVSRSGTNLSALNDKSPNGYHLAASGGSPQFNATCMDGGTKPGVSIASNTIFLMTGSSAVSLGGTTLSVFATAIQSGGVQARLANFVATADVTSNGNDTASAASAAIIYMATAGIFESYHNAARSTTTRPTTGTQHVYGATFSGTQNVVYVDNVAGTPAGDSGTWGATGRIMLMNSNGTSPWDTCAKEWVYLKVVPTTQQRADLHTWLNR